MRTSRRLLAAAVAIVVGGAFLLYVPRGDDSGRRAGVGKERRRRVEPKAQHLAPPAPVPVPVPVPVSSPAPPLPAFHSGRNDRCGFDQLQEVGNEGLYVGLGDQALEDGGNAHWLFVGILSSPENRLQRETVRKAWGTDLLLRQHRIGVRFFVGRTTGSSAARLPGDAEAAPSGEQACAVDRAVMSEANSFNDIVVVDTEEGYENIARKTAAIASFGAARADYVMKCDDDTFVDLRKLVPALRHHEQAAKQSQTVLFWGYMTRDGTPQRDESSPWYLSTAEWPRADFPPFARGAGYVFGRALALHIQQRRAAGTLRYFKLEDVIFGLWAEEFVRQTGQKLFLLHEPLFAVWNCQPRTILCHYQTPELMPCVYAKQLAGRDDVCCSAHEGSQFIRLGGILHEDTPDPVVQVNTNSGSLELAQSGSGRPGASAFPGIYTFSKPLTEQYVIVVEGTSQPLRAIVELQGASKARDLPFHMIASSWLDDLVVNRLYAGKWLGEEKHPTPFRDGESFRMTISFPRGRSIRVEIESGPRRLDVAVPGKIEDIKSLHLGGSGMQRVNFMMFWHNGGPAF